MSTLKVTNITNPTSASTNIALDTNGNATVAGTVAMGSSFLRNRIINGAMDVWQRGTSFTPGNQYTADRWYCNRNGGVAGVTFSQAYGAFGSIKNWMSIQRSNGNTSSAEAVIYQPIEGVNSRDLAGQTVTMSFTVGTGSTLSVTSNNIFLALAYQTTTTDIGVSGSWANITPVSISVPSNTGPTRYTAQFSVPSNSTQLMPYVRFQFAGTAGADDRYYITEVQLEAGSVATPFERRQYGQELALCQRYFQSCDFSQVFNGTNGRAITATKFSASDAIIGNVPLLCSMRTAPTITSTSSTARYVNNIGGSASTPNVNTLTSMASGPIVLNYTLNSLAASYGWLDNFGVLSVSAEL